MRHSKEMGQKSRSKARSGSRSSSRSEREKRKDRSLRRSASRSSGSESSHSKKRHTHKKHSHNEGKRQKKSHSRARSPSASVDSKHTRKSEDQQAKAKKSTYQRYLENRIIQRRHMPFQNALFDFDQTEESYKLELKKFFDRRTEERKQLEAEQKNEEEKQILEKKTKIAQTIQEKKMLTQKEFAERQLELKKSLKDSTHKDRKKSTDSQGSASSKKSSSSSKSRSSRSSSDQSGSADDSSSQYTINDSDSDDSYAEEIRQENLKIKQQNEGADGEGEEDQNDYSLIGPQPINIYGFSKKTNFGQGLLPGEGEAYAQYVESGKRIPRRGEVGLTSEQIEQFEKAGYVMSGSRNARITAVRLRKEAQIYSVQEKKALAILKYEQKIKRESEIIDNFKESIQQKVQQHTKR